MNMNGTSNRPPLLARLGLSARDVILILLIMADVYLVSTGHQALDTKLTQVEAQQARYCGVTEK